MLIRISVVGIIAFVLTCPASAQDRSGCHGVGCQVDNPDAPPDTGISSPEMQRWEQSNRTTDETKDAGSSDEMRRWERSNEPSRSSRDPDRDRRDHSSDKLVGSWTIGERDGSGRCTIALSNEQVRSLRRAWTSPGCTGGLFGNNRWRAYGRNLDITDMGGALVASFRRDRDGGYTGRRVSDGAWLYLSR